MVTALVTFYILRKRRAISKLQVRHFYQSLYTGVVALVIESALPMTLVGAVFAALYAAPIDEDYNVLKAVHTFAFASYALCVSCDASVTVPCISCYHLCHDRTILG